MNSQKPQRNAEKELTKIVLNAAINVHRDLGPGLLKSAYSKCLCFELHEYNL